MREVLYLRLKDKTEAADTLGRRMSDRQPSFLSMLWV